jgi:DNA-binding response OmpR family regulator
LSTKVLVVDDDPAIRELVGQILKKAGFTVHAVESAEEGLEDLRRTLYDVIILDLNLPGLSGMKMCELLKQDPATASLPVIMLTSHSAERMKVQGLETGADDYLVKPPPAAELVARINALLRRVKFAGQPDKVLQVEGLKLDIDRHEVTVQGQSVALRPKEFQLLALFLEKKGRVLTRSFLFEALWGEEVVTEHTLEVHINHLREKLGPLAKCLQTVPGVGYKFLDN